MLFRKQSLGINISDYSIEIISLEGSIEKPKLISMGRSILEPGIIEDGKVLKKEKLAETLGNLILSPQFGQIKTKKFIFSLPESKTFVHSFSLEENLKEKEKIQKIKFEASQNFPYSLEELYYDFIIYPGGETLLAAAPKEIVNPYLEIFKICQIQPLAIETESESLARALIENKEETVLIIDMGAQMTNLSLFEREELRISISNPIAGDKFTQAIAAKFSLPLAEAEKIKKEVGLDPDKKEGRVFLVLQQELQGIIEEIRRIERYFQEKTGKKIEKIVLAGGSALLSHLPEYLSENLEKEVLVGDPWKKINIDILKKKEYLKEALEVEPILYSTAIGSALRGLFKNPRGTGINLIKEIK